MKSLNMHVNVRLHNFILHLIYLLCQDYALAIHFELIMLKLMQAHFYSS